MICALDGQSRHIDFEVRDLKTKTGERSFPAGALQQLS
jgi:hypothetical protein